MRAMLKKVVLCLGLLAGLGPQIVAAEYAGQKIKEYIELTADPMTLEDVVATVANITKNSRIRIRFNAPGSKDLDERQVQQLIDQTVIAIGTYPRTVRHISQKNYEDVMNIEYLIVDFASNPDADYFRVLYAAMREASDNPGMASFVDYSKYDFTRANKHKVLKFILGLSQRMQKDHPLKVTHYPEEAGRGIKFKLVAPAKL